MRPRLCGKPAIQPQTLKSPPRERPATGFWSGDIPKESTACRCVVNSVIALAYGVIAKPFGLIIPVRGCSYIARARIAARLQLRSSPMPLSPDQGERAAEGSARAASRLAAFLAALWEPRQQRSGFRG